MICEAGDNRAKRRAMLKRLGLCCNCRKPADGLHFCQACRDRYNATQREKTKARRDARLCIDCEQPAAVGRVRCQKCLDLRKKESGCRPMQAKQKPCEECETGVAVANGYLCPGCVRLMANDALRKKLHSRCENAGTLDYELEPADRAEFEKLTQVRETKPEPVELPVYSLRAIADVARMNH